MSPVAALDPSAVRLGRARGRYFRENFAQGGVDLVQIIPELVTNADAAIAASGRQSGRIMLAVARARPRVPCAVAGADAPAALAGAALLAPRAALHR